MNDPLGDGPSCPKGKKADEIYKVEAIVSNNNGSWQYAGGGKWNEYDAVPEGYNSNSKTSPYTGQEWGGYSSADLRMRRKIFATDNPIKRK
ncbi:hypothetical protein AAG747_26830 [Rapidithrix thailandica]|uniref:Uncharacterized protein n=1 Tax=Rapidithrix thailandica TaxID=413964 RepID=A0AAW9S8P5_9BACT